MQERIEYKIISTTCKVLYSLPVHITFAISLPSSLPDPLGRRHCSPSFTHKLSRVSKSLTALFGMRHLTYGTNFLHLFAFLVSQPPQSALLHCQAPTLFLNRWLACLTGSSTLILKLTFSPDPFPRNLSHSVTDRSEISRFYPARVRKSLALKTLVSAAD